MCVKEGDSLSTNSVCVRGVESVYVIVRLSACVRERKGEFLTEIVWVRVECVAVCCGVLRCVAVSCSVL